MMPDQPGRRAADLARPLISQCQAGDVRNPDLPMPGEQEIRAPDGQWYLVRSSGEGVERANFFNLAPSMISGLLWNLRRRKRWQVEVFRFDRFGVTYPPVLRERFDDPADAESRATELVRELSTGEVGWDRWQRPQQGTDPPPPAG
jgi:hypothetical protein